MHCSNVLCRRYLRASGIKYLASSFAGMGILPPQPVDGFERRFADLDDQACEHLYAMLGRARDPPEHLLNEGA